MMKKGVGNILITYQEMFFCSCTQSLEWTHKKYVYKLILQLLQ